MYCRVERDMASKLERPPSSQTTAGVAAIGFSSAREGQQQTIYCQTEFGARVFAGTRSMFARQEAELEADGAGVCWRVQRTRLRSSQRAAPSSTYIDSAVHYLVCGPIIRGRSTKCW